MTAEGSAAHPEGSARLWERQALTRARVVLGELEFVQQVRDAIREAVYDVALPPGYVNEIASMREKLELSRPSRDLKRGPGGLADVEFLVQRFQLAYGREVAALRVTNTWQALVALREADLLSRDDYTTLRSGYDFLLRVQNRLRIVHNRTLDAVPEIADEVEKLARRLGQENGQAFLDELQQHRHGIRDVYLRVMGRK